jgi:hypothetical protein
VLNRWALPTLAALALVSLATAAVAEAAPHDSIKIVLPNRIGSGTVKMSLTGRSSGSHPAVWLVSQNGNCSSNYNVESHRNVTIWISGQSVHDGTFRVKYLPHLTGASVKGVHFCAYLTLFTTSDTFVTEAYESLHVKK